MSNSHETILAGTSTVPHSTRTRVTNPLQEQDWDSRVARLPGSSFFHGQSWAKVLHSTYRFSPSYFLAEDDQGIKALIPFMEINSWLTGRRGVALPFTDECGPLCESSAAFDPLMKLAAEYARSNGWKYYELRGGRSMVADSLPSTSFWGHRVELHPDEKVQLSQVGKSAKGVLKKVEQSGLTIEISQSLEALHSFHWLLCKTRKRHGVPPQPISFFNNIHQHILARDEGCVILAKKDNLPIAGAVYFHSGKSALYKYAASDEKFKSLGANSLVMWRGIRWYAEKGFSDLNLGRSSLSNEGLRKFKLSWGSKEYQIDYVRYSVPEGKYVVHGEDQSGWATKVFNVLPMGISKLLGAVLYKHVA